MDITGLGWCGTRTEHDQQLAHFYEHVLDLRPVYAEPGLRVFELPDGRRRVCGTNREISRLLLGPTRPVRFDVWYRAGLR